MDHNFFQRLAVQSNKYVWKDMMSINSTLYLGHEQKNIENGKIIRFFGIMLRISYFLKVPVFILGSGYCCKLRVYQCWTKDKYIISLVRFKQIRSVFHPEAGTSNCEDKFHQLCYIIRMSNYNARRTCSLGPNAAFDKGQTAMMSQYCPVRQYNKYEPSKYRVDLFILANDRDYFIYHINIYQCKNKANADIDSVLKSLLTT